MKEKRAPYYAGLPVRDTILLLVKAIPVLPWPFGTHVAGYKTDNTHVRWT